MEGEDLERGLGIGIVGRLEPEVGDAHLFEKDLHEADEVAEGDAVVGHDALDLVELGEMRSVDRLVAEDAVDGEELGGLESTGWLASLYSMAELTAVVWVRSTSFSVTLRSKG